MTAMRPSVLALLALSAGCATLAGLDGDYVVGSTSDGGSGGVTTASGSPSGSATGGQTASGGAGGRGGAGATGGAGAAGGATLGYCEEPGLVACYPFEGNGQDASGTGNDATTASVQYAAGQVGQAIVLDASSLVTVAPSQSLAIGAFTLEVWLNPSSLPGSGERFAIGDWTVVFNAWVYPWGVRCIYDPGVMTGTPILANQWTHIACAHDGTTLRTYVDGVETASEDYVPNSSAPTSTLFIGANEPDGADKFLGMLDEMRLFDHARSQAQICAAAAPNCP